MNSWREPKMLCPRCEQHVHEWAKDAVRVRCGGCMAIVWETPKARKRREQDEAKAVEIQEEEATTKDLERAQAQRRRAKERRVRAKMASKLAVLPAASYAEEPLPGHLVPPRAEPTDLGTKTGAAA
jgi:hypothetical protein